MNGEEKIWFNKGEQEDNRNWEANAGKLRVKKKCKGNKKKKSVANEMSKGEKRNKNRRGRTQSDL